MDKAAVDKAVVLIIEDDPEIQEMLALAFSGEGWKLQRAATGEDGLGLLEAHGADCIILDIMLPGMDGLKTLKKIKAEARFKGIPVILATAKGEDPDIVAGLELGADDYVVKPYSPRVLIARIRAALRRIEEAKSSGDGAGRELWRAGKLTLDTLRHEVSWEGKALELSATEFAMLLHFMSHPDIVFSRNRIISAVHGPDYPVTDRSVDVQVLALRKKLGKAGEMIETIRGVGYRFKEAE
ncbi:MAG: response regulator transcription factor [Spirochaetaceae bacterium]|jgi:two-component system phosphate regulon response regulator PhoB|nr:response regulator transcription factor [Spirochaetaceae bacterium]